MTALLHRDPSQTIAGLRWLIAMAPMASGTYGWIQLVGAAVYKTNATVAADAAVGIGAAGIIGAYSTLKGMVNVPVGDTLGVRLAGYYLNRDGYTTNLFDNSKIDNRDMWGARASLRFEPNSGTTIDLMAQYFHEKDNRMRIQKQMCQRDPTGVLGCLNARRDFSMTNSNTTFVGVLTSQQFFATQGLPTSLALGSIYGADPYAGVTNPADFRTVNTDTKPSYYTQEWIAQGSIDQDLGSGLSLKVSGNYQKVDLDSSQDYNNSVQNRAVFTPGLTTLAALAGGAGGAGLAAVLTPVANALIPNGPTGVLCTSLPEETGTGVFGGHKSCGMTPQDFDRSDQFQTSWTAEAILSSKWDGPFNFLLGGIYGKLHVTENSYYVDSFGIDYFTGLVGALSSSGAGYLGTPTYRSNTDDMQVKTYGLFGEAYYKFNDSLKMTVGLRYNHDDKTVKARTTLASFLVPFNSTNAYTSPFIASFDADAGIAGNQPFQVRNVKFGEWTGRAVLDWNITPDNLLYASYSRGYKSGGINPPLSPVFAVPESFNPEFVNAFEVGSKNTFGKVQLNLTGFYYDYKGLQLSRIVARTSVNDNVDAKIYGLEAEAVLHPTRELTLNLNASYLHTEVSQDKMLSNPRDFGAGRSDAVIIKDITNGANCAVASNTGNVAGVNSFVNKTNALINNGIVPGLRAGAGLQNTAAFPADGGIASTGAFSVCGALTAAAAGSFNLTALGPLAVDPAALGGVTVYSSGIPVNIKGHKLPGAPDYKFSAGIQYAAAIGDMTLTPRADFIYTGKSVGNIFGGAVNEIPSFTQVNAQLQLDGPDKKWYARAWVQNLFNKDSITGLYVTDQSSGNYTNLFTLEPRRYGLTAGVKF
mgnify:FL=1